MYPDLKNGNECKENIYYYSERKSNSEDISNDLCDGRKFSSENISKVKNEETLMTEEDGAQ